MHFMSITLSSCGAEDGVSIICYSADIDMLCVSIVAHSVDIDVHILDCFYVLFISSFMMPCILF